jgi:ClpP class serine protease
MTDAPLHLLARMLRERPVAIEPRAFAEIDRQLCAAIAARLDGAPRSRADADDPPSDGPAADDGLPPPFVLGVDGVAKIPLRGVCGRHLSRLAMDCGGCDVDRVAEAIRFCDADGDALAILLECDSPGGSVCGVAECAEAVAACRKPIVAWIPDQCCSAAYWIASQADAIYCGPTAEIGSVGVCCALLDESRAYDQKGLRVELFASGGNKGAGVPGTSLTDGQRERMQASVNDLADIFRRAVLARRPIDPALLDGRTEIGAKAVLAGFADTVASENDARRDAFALAKMKGATR